MAQITSVTSEALQAEIRRLLPSQQGFGEDLQASNVILPIIDLTPAAEGSSVSQLLQTALAFGSNTAYEAIATSTDVITNTTGFFRIIGTSTLTTASNQVRSNIITISDGLSTNTLYTHKIDPGGAAEASSVSFDLVVFVNSGETVTAVSSAADTVISGSSRQIADINGNLVNPVGFNPQ